MKQEIMSIPKYRRYKDSGYAWLGNIPEHWEVKKAKRLFKKENRPIQKNDEIITCFRDGEVTLRKNRKTEGFTNALQEIGYQRICAGDLVIHAMDAFAGAIGVSDSTGKSSPVYSACTPIKENTVNAHYYAYFLRNLALSGVIVSLAKGIRERSTDFRFNDFGTLQLSVPPINEQQAIASFLDKKTALIDKAIEKKEVFYNLLNEKLDRAIVAEIIGEKLLSSELNINKLSSNIPKNLSITRLKFLIDSIQNGSWGDEPCDDSSDMICVRVADFNWARKRIKLNNPTIRSYDPSQSMKLQLQKGDLLIEKSGGGEKTPVGRVVLWDRDENAVCSNFVARIRPNKDVNSEYLLFIFYALYALKYAHQFIKQNTGIQNLDDKKLLSTKILIPDLDKQTEIVKSLNILQDKYNSIIERTNESIEKLKELKKSLISEAVTGQLDIAKWQKQRS